MFFMMRLFFISFSLLRACSFRQLVPPPRQKCEPRLLVGDALRHQFVVGSSRIGGRLLDQLAKVLSQDCHLVVDIGDVGGALRVRTISSLEPDTLS